MKNTQITLKITFLPNGLYDEFNSIEEAVESMTMSFNETEIKRILENKATNFKTEYLLNK